MSKKNDKANPYVWDFDVLTITKKKKKSIEVGSALQPTKPAPRWGPWKRTLIATAINFISTLPMAYLLNFISWNSNFYKKIVNSFGGDEMMSIVLLAIVWIALVYLVIEVYGRLPQKEKEAKKT